MTGCVPCAARGVSGIMGADRPCHRALQNRPSAPLTGLTAETGRAARHRWVSIYSQSVRGTGAVRRAPSKAREDVLSGNLLFCPLNRYVGSPTGPRCVRTEVVLSRGKSAVRSRSSWEFLRLRFRLIAHHLRLQKKKKNYISLCCFYENYTWLVSLRIPNNTNI